MRDAGHYRSPTTSPRTHAVGRFYESLRAGSSLTGEPDLGHAHVQSHDGSASCRANLHEVAELIYEP
jgi:hypothetical protein